MISRLRKNIIEQIIQYYYIEMVISESKDTLTLIDFLTNVKLINNELKYALEYDKFRQNNKS